MGPSAEKDAIQVIESFRKQNPMNGDGSNYTIDRILTALVGPAELDRLKREHQDRWNAEYIETRARLDAEERAARRYCLRCEVPIYQDGAGVWRREATGSQVCPRNPAVDGHEPVPHRVLPPGGSDA